MATTDLSDALRSAWRHNHTSDALEGADVFVFMALHYPSADNVAALAQGMEQMRSWMESQPGCLGVEPPLLTEDWTCLVGYSR